ncbi:alpha-amylase family glycosyl hydrolase [Streptomyces sp. MP131-18]|uniref:alpha-amylase family glycosyl hydrolase n=1 Tax=Streptomyces sp. MP131-18 TaxID=1857892 RepID=UPI00097C92C5|nr:alpha-amylase family glycosyl hydrolase [Streptomyces sp. MP131-18]ONK14836.1 Trehalose synthase/amylase TreS [Streptomyces sp. MP131-18]
MPSFRPAPAWLPDAVLYQIYPQSFADANGDGIGDFAGVTERIDHLAWLGVNTIWLNPCFASPFNDAGYDISDYLSVAPRYGTADDLAQLVDTAGRRGIRVLLDLVAGHTSDQHPWFRAAIDDPADQRYIWTESTDGLPDNFVASPGSRPGGYLPNFFESQPALNFGYARKDPAEPWRLPVGSEGPRANRAALREIMDHWLRLGLAGFRVDMAHSLVKDDPGLIETGRLWTELRTWLDSAHPHAALLAEWGDPAVSVPAGFHSDFFLQFGGPSDGLPLRSLWNNNHGTVAEHWTQRHCYFDADGGGTAGTFVTAWESVNAVIGDQGFITLPSANHDFSRLCCGPRTAEQLPAAFAFQLTWPTLPAIYYGDEIGMRYLPGLPDHEGSVLGPRYNRAGSRTPMQWDDSPGAGFSTAPADRLYLPVDPDPGRPTVAGQRADPDSLLHLVRRLIALRKSVPELGSRSPVNVLHTGYPLVYTRGDCYLIAVNPRREPASYTLAAPGPGEARPVETNGATLSGQEVTVPGFGFGIFAY